MVETNTAQGLATEIGISELRGVKGFGDATILKLKSSGIDTIKQLKEKMDTMNASEMQEMLTPIQYKQAQNYFIENPYVY